MAAILQFILQVLIRRLVEGIIALQVGSGFSLGNMAIPLQFIIHQQHFPIPL